MKFKIQNRKDERTFDLQTADHQLYHASNRYSNITSQKVGDPTLSYLPNIPFHHHKPSTKTKLKGEDYKVLN